MNVKIQEFYHEIEIFTITDVYPSGTGTISGLSFQLKAKKKLFHYLTHTLENENYYQEMPLSLDVFINTSVILHFLSGDSGQMHYSNNQKLFNAP